MPDPVASVRDAGARRTDAIVGPTGFDEVTFSVTWTGPSPCGNVTALVKPELPTAGNVVVPLVEVCSVRLALSPLGMGSGVAVGAVVGTEVGLGLDFGVGAAVPLALGPGNPTDGGMLGTDELEHAAVAAPVSTSARARRRGGPNGRRRTVEDGLSLRRKGPRQVTRTTTLRNAPTSIPSDIAVSARLAGN
jgi:hypothetical protein